MPNTFTTNFNLTKPEVGGANDTWGELCNTNFTDIDSQLYRKQDKTDQKGTTHTLTFTSGSTNVTTNVTRGFASFAVNDKITISHSGNANNKGEFLIEGITNDITLDLKETDDSEPTFASESVSSTVSIITEINKIEGSLDVSGDTLTTSTAQKDAIVDGSTAISRSAGSIQTLTITAAGSCYVGNGTLSATGGAGSGFAGTYTISSGAVNAVAITNAGSGYTSAPTIVLTPASGSAGSGANITPTLYTANDVDFAGDVSVTGDLVVTGAASLTSGTITNGVTQDGVVRLIKCVNISGTEYQGQDNTNLYVAHDSISVPVTAGKTYLVETDFTIYMEDDTTSGTSDFDSGVVCVYLRLHNDSSARNQSDNSSSTTAYGDVLKFGWKQLTLWDDSTTVVKNYNWTDTVNLKGAFTAGSTGTRHIHYTYQNRHSADDMWPKFGSGIQQTYFIYEVTGVTVESLTTAA